MRNIRILAAALALAAVAGCSKTADGDLEVERPVVGTVTDTLNIPQVNITTDSVKVAVPDIDIKKDTTTIKVPDIDIKK